MYILGSNTQQTWKSILHAFLEYYLMENINTPFQRYHYILKWKPLILLAKTGGERRVRWSIYEHYFKLVKNVTQCDDDSTYSINFWCDMSRGEVSISLLLSHHCRHIIFKIMMTPSCWVEPCNKILRNYHQKHNCILPILDLCSQIIRK